ncbi:MAG: NAD(P)-dependent oxidoreductase [Mastigocoleus sp.]
MKVAFLGTGLMGLPMANRLWENGVNLTAYNRTPEKLELLKQKGIQVTTVPEQATRDADCIILMLTNTMAIYSVLLSDTSWRTLAGKTVIQMGTITPSESKQIQESITAAGGEYLEAPVLGSIPEAKAGKLIIMVGGQRQQYQRYLELLKNFGSDPLLVGSVGSAAALKLALNQLIVSLTSAFALSLGFLQRQNVDIDAFMKILRESALYAPTFDKKLPRMLDENFENPNFPTKHLLKDTNLFIDEAENLGLDVSNLEALGGILDKAIKMSLANKDYSSLYSAITSVSEE